jgi:hypothetical protein
MCRSSVSFELNFVVSAGITPLQLMLMNYFFEDGKVMEKEKALNHEKYK